MAPREILLKSKEYDEDFYEERVEAGIDYLTFGEWHRHMLG